MHKPNDEAATYTAAERDHMIKRMDIVSRRFYTNAQQTHCHAFLEFTGLMNEFIKICYEASLAGVDFTQLTGHSGASLPMRPYQAAYIREKLECIFGKDVLETLKMAGDAEAVK